jgi:hypothetical protein
MRLEKALKTRFMLDRRLVTGVISSICPALLDNMITIVLNREKKQYYENNKFCQERRYRK